MANMYFIWVAETFTVTLDRKSNLFSADAGYFDIFEPISSQVFVMQESCTHWSTFSASF